MVNRRSPLPLYRQVADALEAELAAGEIQPGDRLPGEAELAATHGVHRLTVRQALGDLASRGLIATVHGRGSFVAHPPLRHTIDGTREASLTRAMRDSGHTVRQMLLRATRDDAPHAAKALKTRAHLRRVDLLRFVDEVPWTLTSTWLPERRFGGLDRHWDGGSSLYEALEQHYGIRMRRAHRTIWTEPAGPLDAEHLMVGVGAPLLLMRGVNVTEEGRPVALVEHRGRGDRMQVVVSFDGS